MLQAQKGSCAWAPYLCHEGWVPDWVGTRQRAFEGGNTFPLWS